MTTEEIMENSRRPNYMLPLTEELNKPVLRTFETGATRDLDVSKIDYEACLSPLVLECFGEYMLSCSVQADGSRRPGDNWKKGIPLNSYIKSMLRHVWDVWKLHSGYPVIDRKTRKPVTIEQACCAVLFNIQGYLHEYLKKKNGIEQVF